MNLRVFVCVVIGMASGCTKDAPPPPPDLIPPPPIALRLGPCAPIATTWVSGPVPADVNDEAIAKQGRFAITPITDPSKVPPALDDVPPPSMQIAMPRSEGGDMEVRPATDDAERARAQFRPDGPWFRRGAITGGDRGGLLLELEASRTAMLRCFKGSDKPGFAQKFVLRFHVTPGPRGQHLIAVTATDGIEGETSACVKAVVKRWHLFYRLDDETTPEFAPGNVVMPLEVRNDALPPLPPPTKRIYPVVGGGGDGTPYKPKTLLTPLVPAIEKCLVGYGAGVIQTGAHAEVFGVPAKAAACIRPLVTALPDERRCSFAFGTMPFDQVSAIDVTETPSKIDFAARQAKFLGDAPPVVDIYGVNAIRAHDDIAMKHVWREVGNVLMAREDFVLGRWDPTTKQWRPVDTSPDAPTFPVAPMPLGTGGTWNRLNYHGLPSGVQCECVYFTILSSAKAVWLTTSRINEHLEIVRDASFAKNLAATLKAKKHSTFFENKTDVEIGAMDDSTYGELVEVIDAAVAAGWIDWKLLPIEDLHGGIPMF